MKHNSFDDCHKLLEDFIKNEKIVRLVEGLDGEEEMRGISREDISSYLQTIGIFRVYMTSQDRNQSVHIFRNEKLLCGKQFLSQEKELFDLDKITCKKCISEYNRTT